ncbi:hypothetical protein PR202_gb05653 [Eleusine coracana subsp. coracana]|uniref:RCD1 WWE domain-containing protein n=1 Tax=Eleusine coracana subsp. coracana TaxID=191504 RepID=A0AAV5E7G7_ELECO|nr:hypothetical protein PR202_gb05653 [Eleusine coracana subsp. coracana]
MVIRSAFGQGRRSLWPGPDRAAHGVPGPARARGGRRRGRAFLFDFLRMARIDVDTAEKAPQGWIDGHGACYFSAPTRSPRRGWRRWSGESRGTSDSGSGSAAENAKKMKKQAVRWESAAALEGATGTTSSSASCSSPAG